MIGVAVLITVRRRVSQTVGTIYGHCFLQVPDLNFIAYQVKAAEIPLRHGEM